MTKKTRKVNGIETRAKCDIVGFFDAAYDIGSSSHRFRAGYFSSSLSASSFSGAGTGLTGTGSSFTAGAIVNQANSATIAASVTATANSIVLRNSSGFTTQSYIEYAPTNEVAGSITGIVTKQGDDYLRMSSSAGVQTFLGLNTAAYRAANQDLNTTSNVTFNQGTFTNGAFDSDERLKDIINRQVKTSISDKVNVMSYTWKDQNKGVGVQYGYSAQELKKLIPEAVVVTKNNTYAVNYNMVHSVLIDENTRKIQGLEKKIEELKETIEKLKDK